MPEAQTILPDNSHLPEYLDFDKLRILGRNRIAQLSGKIWTDHNIHDPGITILEVLAYAIMDIGYRNQLPDKELFARNLADGQQEDNFFTPAQILSANPLTILDFRKLILDIDGVRNVWLEIADKSEVDVEIDCQRSRLSFVNPNKENGFIPLHINGLYKVLLDLDPLRPVELTEENVVRSVRDLLHQHRNLCEDFVEIKVLKDTEIAICSELELTSNADPDATMVKVLEVINEFLSPTINYYTLQQLLDKGKTIDEIFEGRPLRTEVPNFLKLDQEEKTDACEKKNIQAESKGFIDTEELERLEKISEIHVSDLYREILKIDEVRGIKKLALQPYEEEKPLKGIDGRNVIEEWCLMIAENRRAILSVERSEFTFFKDVLRFQPDKGKVIERFRKRLSNVRKARLKPYQLDLEPPLGLFRKDLATYRSIQHDFPVVYGIGEGHLSGSVAPTRDTQALQLKGYLLFFDQLLTNYLGQLANIRDLFSLKPESLRVVEEKGRRTYFPQPLKDVPRANELIRFYQDRQASDNDSDIIAVWSIEDNELPLSSEERKLAISDSMRAFRLGRVRFEIIEMEEDGTYYFEAEDQLQRPFLKSIQVYESYQEAQSAIEILKFLAVQEDAYRPFTLLIDGRNRYTFEILYNPLNYWQYLNKIIESKEEYLVRRDQFLNHLLARFSEHFSEYVLLMFALNGERYDLEKTVQDKSHYLYHYPELSRNRGKAYNYRDESALWNSKNISGFEKRVTAMMGIPDFIRQNLNNFQVKKQDKNDYYRLYYKGSVVLQGQYGYESRKIAREKLDVIFDLAKTKENYVRVDCPLTGAYTFKLVSGKNNEAIHPGTYPSEKIREEMIDKLVENLELQDFVEIIRMNPNLPTGFYKKSKHELFANTERFAGSIFKKDCECQKSKEDDSYRYQIIDEEEIYAQNPVVESNSQKQGDLEKELKGKLKDLDEQYSRICFGEKRAVIKFGDNYHYQLVQVVGVDEDNDGNTDKNKAVVLWRSYETFASAELALQAFDQEFFTVIELAGNAANYVEVSIDGKNTFALVREEEDFLAFLPVDEMEEEDLPTAKKTRIIHSLQFPVFRMEEENRFSFRLIQLNPDLSLTEDWVGTSSYQSPKTAWKRFFEYLELLRNSENWFWAEGDKGLQLSVGERLIESECGYFSEYSAWEATKEFTDQFKEDHSLDIFTDFWNDCTYSFRIVNRDYRLAVHPYSYNSSEEREVVMSCLRKNALARKKFFHLVYKDVIEEDTHSWYFVIRSHPRKPSDKYKHIVWQGSQFYSSKEEAEKAYDEQYIMIMNLARKAENYQFIKTNESKCKVVLCNERQEIVAVMPWEFDQDSESYTRLEKIVKRIKFARLFPITQAGSGYQFDIYDFHFNREKLLEKTWDIISGTWDMDACSQVRNIEPLETRADGYCSREEKLHLVRCIDDWIGGGVALKSTRTYQSLPEILEVLHWLKDHHYYLFRQIDSYQPVNTQPCGPYSIEFVNPAGILAVSPRKFITYSDCLKAVERTHLKVNAEGLHLVEHVLLRPVKNAPDTYIHCVKDLEGNIILYGTEEYSNSELVNKDSSKEKFIEQIKAAVSAIPNNRPKKGIRPGKKDHAEKEMPDYEWQQKIRLYENDQIIATGCHLPVSEKAFFAGLKYLENLKKASVSSCHITDKQCDDSLIEVCIHKEDCVLPASNGTTAKRCGKTIQTEENIFDGYIPGADPYSFWTTIIIPHWPRRFQNANFRTFFSNTIRRELPAYVAPRILWVNPRDMRTFEQAFQAWMKAKSKVEQLKLSSEAEANDSPVKKNSSGLDLTASQANSSDWNKAIDELDQRQRKLIQIMFSMNSEYKFARFEGLSSNSNDTVQLNETKLA